MAVGFAQSNNLVVNADDAFLNLSINTRSKSFAFDATESIIVPQWVPSDSITSNVINLSPITRTGNKVSTYSDIFYNRIWIIPSSIDLTGAPTSFSTTVSVWNSYFQEKTMTAVTPNNIFGITFSPTVPETFTALEYKNYTLSLTSSVPATVNGFYTFTFSDAEDPTLDISGVLAVAFPFLHDWGNDGTLIERIGYLTGVIESKNGTEQRSRLRKYPRRQLSYKCLLADGSDVKRNAIQRAAFHNATTFGMSKVWLIPINQDARRLGYTVASGTTAINVDTQYHDYCVNGYVLIHKAFDNYEIVRVASLTNSSITLVAPTANEWGAGAAIMPMRQCIAGQETIEGNIITYELEEQTSLWDVLVQDNADSRKVPYVPTDVYKGYDVYKVQSDFEQDTSAEIYNPQRRLDAQVGIFRQDSRYAVTKERMPFSLLLKSKLEIAEFIGFLDYRAGKLNPFWYPSFSMDLQLTLDGTADDNTIRVVNTGYSTYMNSTTLRKDLMFMRNDGTYFFRRITGASDNGDGTETISLDQSMGADFTTTDFKYICFLKFVRLDSDVFEINYLTSDIATVTTKTIDLFEIP